MHQERNFDPTAGRDVRVASQNKERTAQMDSIDRQNVDASELARRGQEQERQRQDAQRRHEQFQRDIAVRETDDRQANQSNKEAARLVALERAAPVDASRRADIQAPTAESGMVKTVDTEWEKNIAALPKSEDKADKPPKKKWLGLFG